MGFSEWETPQEFYEALNEEFGFTVDVCAKSYNAKHTNFFDPEKDGLSQLWTGVCWLNPPYDKTISQWMAKAYQASRAGATVVCLIQGRSTDTIMWHEYVMKAAEIRFVKDRLHFGNHGVFTRANISSVVVVFTPEHSGPPAVSSIDRFGRRLT